MSTFALLKWGFVAFVCFGSLMVVVSILIKKRLGFFSGSILFAMVLGGLFFIDILVIEPNGIEVRRVRIHDDKLEYVFRDLRVVQITDIHLTDGLGFREQQLIKKVNDLKPDIIFFTGDVIDSMSQFPHARELFRSLKAKVGIYGVPGNTDHIVTDAKTLKQELWGSGVDILINEHRRVLLPTGRVLWLIGVDDPKYGYDKIHQAIQRVPPGAPAVMLAHGPYIFEDAINYGINLLLVGDTHGGQVGIDFLVRLSDYANRSPYMKGLFEEKNTQMYVNRGIGMKTLPIRFLCRPEIAVFDFVK